tara:strand:+ start:1435 stop:2289 length:855 start_codon:yes stop_codon:yes gene_type:complete
MKKTVLMTGSSGFIGRHVKKKLKSHGFDLIENSRSKIEKKNTIYSHLDLSDLTSIRKIFEENKIDVVIHLGTKVGFNKNISELFVENVMATKLIADLAFKQNSFLIFASGTIVYNSNIEFVDDQTKPDPDNSYGKSKLLAENYIIESGVRYSIHRISGVFGYNGPTHLSLNNSIMMALNNKQLKLINNNNVQRNYIYVKDIAEIIYKTVIEDINGIHIVAGEEIKTFEEMIIDINSILNPKLQPKIIKGLQSSKTQIYEHSKNLPKPTGFIESLKDIKMDYLKK